MGGAINNCRPSIWMEELVWEALFGCLESYSVMFDVDSVEGAE